MWRLRNRYSLMIKMMTQFNFSGAASAIGALGRINSSISCIFGESMKNRRMSSGPEEKSFFQLKNILKEPICGTSFNDKNDILYLEFEKSERLEFPVLWLRDNCQCPECFDQLSRSRILDQRLLRKNLRPREVTSSAHGLRIIWDGGHVSDFSEEWLRNHSFSEDHRKERCKRGHLDRECWNAKDFEERFKKFSYIDVLNEDSVLLEWLKNLSVYGIAILTSAPRLSGQLEQLAERIAFIRKTHYGEQFSVVGSDDADNVAYRKGALQLHTDLPYYNYTPGIVMLHCIQPSSEGGENVLSDGLNAASQLPTEMYKVLAETVVDWVDIGSHESKPFHSMNREPVLCLNASRQLEKINWSQPQRDSVFNVSASQAVEWYNAAIEFTRIIHDKNNAVMFKTNIGEILTFDNRRILHGRSNYKDSYRLLYGAYVDWDEIYSKIRVLQSN